MQDTYISLAHGNGGRFMRELIDEIFASYLANDDLDVRTDAASLSLDSTEIVFTTPTKAPGFVGAFFHGRLRRAPYH